MIEDGLYSYLSSQSPITALIGSGTSIRLFPNRIPQGAALPCISYSRVGSEHERHLRGTAGIATARIQVDCWAGGATGYSTVKSLANAVRLELDGYRGLMGTLDFVNDCQLDNMTDFYDEPAHASDHGTHRVSMDFSIVYQETTV